MRKLIEFRISISINMQMILLPHTGFRPLPLSLFLSRSKDQAMNATKNANTLRCVSPHQSAVPSLCPSNNATLPFVPINAESVSRRAISAPPRECGCTLPRLPLGYCLRLFPCRRCVWVVDAFCVHSGTLQTVPVCLLFAFVTPCNQSRVANKQTASARGSSLGFIPNTCTEQRQSAGSRCFQNERYDSNHVNHHLVCHLRISHSFG